LLPVIAHGYPLSPIVIRCFSIVAHHGPLFPIIARRCPSLPVVCPLLPVIAVVAVHYLLLAAGGSLPVPRFPACRRPQQEKLM